LQVEPQLLPLLAAVAGYELLLVKRSVLMVARVAVETVMVPLVVLAQQGKVMRGVDLPLAAEAAVVVVLVQLGTRLL
jgi:hypothetical protein